MKKKKINKILKSVKEKVKALIKTPREATDKEVNDATLNLDPDKNSWGSRG